MKILKTLSLMTIIAFFAFAGNTFATSYNYQDCSPANPTPVPTPTPNVPPASASEPMAIMALTGAIAGMMALRSKRQ